MTILGAFSLATFPSHFLYVLVNYTLYDYIFTRESSYYCF